MRDDEIQNESINIDYFDVATETNEDKIRVTLYSYKEYKIATKEELVDDMDVIPEVRLVIESNGYECPIKVKSIENALKIINIIEE